MNAKGKNVLVNGREGWVLRVETVADGVTSATVTWFQVQWNWSAYNEPPRVWVKANEVEVL
jgi:hypothetical protein